MFLIVCLWAITCNASITDAIPMVNTIMERAADIIARISGTVSQPALPETSDVRYAGSPPEESPSK